MSVDSSIFHINRLEKIGSNYLTLVTYHAPDESIPEILVFMFIEFEHKQDKLVLTFNKEQSGFVINGDSSTVNWWFKDDIEITNDILKMLDKEDIIKHLIFSEHLLDAIVENVENKFKSKEKEKA